MTNICTKVTVRKRPIKNGQTSLYLDFYPPIRNPKTGKLSRREYLGLYIYTNPVERFQQEYNKSMIQKAEIIKCRRTESIYNPQIQISAVSGTKRSIFRQKNKTKRSKKRLHTTLIKPEQKVNEDLCSGFIVL